MYLNGEYLGLLASPVQGPFGPVSHSEGRGLFGLGSTRRGALAILTVVKGLIAQFRTLIRTPPCRVWGSGLLNEDTQATLSRAQVRKGVLPSLLAGRRQHKRGALP